MFQISTMADIVNKAIGITIGLILLAYLILPIAGELVVNGSWSDVGIDSKLATGLMIIVIVLFLFTMVKQGGKRS